MSNLTATERQVLGELILDKDTPVQSRTLSAVAKRANVSETEVPRILQQLESADPPLVHRDTDATLGLEFWIALGRRSSSLKTSRTTSVSCHTASGKPAAVPPTLGGLGGRRVIAGSGRERPTHAARRIPLSHLHGDTSPALIVMPRFLSLPRCTYRKFPRSLARPSHQDREQVLTYPHGLWTEAVGLRQRLCAPMTC